MRRYGSKILNVDLSGRIEEESLSEELCRQFIGGYGIGARILFSRQSPQIDPLGPHNILGFVTGPLTGTPIPFSSRYVVVGKSPLTGTWGDANSGGDFGPCLKFSGYDAIFFSGISDSPVYLFIDDGIAELRDATHLWGKDTNETEDLLLAELGGGVHMACIGPAGEKQSLIAAIINNKGRAAARSGLAAVMGSKRLKAVVVRGSKDIPLADRERTSKLRKKQLAELVGPAAERRRKFGTCAGMASNVMVGNTPTKNWGGVGPIDFPNASAISDMNVIKYEVKKFACWRCPTACGGHMKVKEGPYAVVGHKPEYETLASFGSMCLNDNVESIIKANDICNRYGLDTISTGSTIAFAIECYENGLITKEDTEGIELTWGNHAAIITITEKLAKREGFGAVLADGVKAAAERIGKGAYIYAVHVQGQEPGMHDPRFRPGIATTYMMDATPGRHMQGGAQNMERRPRSLPGLDVAQLEPYVYNGKGETHRKIAALRHVVSAAGLCFFGPIADNAIAVAESLTAVTGWEYTIGDLLEAGDRIATIRHAFNLREGLNAVRFEVPNRMIGKPPLDVGPTAGVEVDLDTQVRDYLKSMDWDVSTAKPSEKRLMELGLEDVAKIMWS